MQKFCGVNTVLKESWESMRADRFLNRADQLGRIFVRIILHGICTVEYTSSVSRTYSFFGRVGFNNCQVYFATLDLTNRKKSYILPSIFTKSS